MLEKCDFEMYLLKRRRKRRSKKKRRRQRKSGRDEIVQEQGQEKHLVIREYIR